MSKLDWRFMYHTSCRGEAFRCLVLPGCGREGHAACFARAQCSGILCPRYGTRSMPDTAS